MTSVNLFSSVVLVEDDSSHTLLIKRALKQYVSEIRHYDNATAAISSIQKDAPDLVITDLNLPDSTGVEHVAKLGEAQSDLPILVLTSSTSLTDAVEAMKLGARDFIVKNFGSDFSEVLGLSLSRVAAQSQLEAEKLRLQREMAVLQVAIENSHDGLAVVNESGVVRYANGAFREFVDRCGGESEQLFSIATDRLNRADDLKADLIRNLTELSAGGLWNTEVSFIDDPNLAFDLSLSVFGSTTEIRSTTLKSCVVWVRDISEQKRRERFQREILATTTHDLKGPLGAIITGSELLIEQLEPSSRPAELVLRVSSAAHGILNMIEEFLSARRIREGSFILRPSTQTLTELFEEIESNFTTMAAARSQKLSFKLSAPEMSICVDRLGFSRVLGNLVSNAIKFTPREGSIAVTADKEQGYTAIQVCDDGAGMEPAHAQHIFERFSRLKQHEDVSGSGLGLFVVKCIVEAHGGSIQVVSAPGRGTTFIVRFPEEPPVNERGEVISLEFT